MNTSKFALIQILLIASTFVHAQGPPLGSIAGENSSYVTLDKTIRSLKLNTDTIRKTIPLAWGISLEALFLKATPIGIVNAYYPDGQLCETALFDSIPIDRTSYSSYDGGPGNYVTVPLASPIYLMKFYSNGKTWKKIHFDKGDSSVLRQSHYQVLHKEEYYRTGDLSLFEMKRNRKRIKYTINFQLELGREEITKKNKLIYSDYSSVNTVNPEYQNKILRTIQKRKNTEQRLFSSLVLVKRITYDQTTKKALKVEIYDKGTNLIKKTIQSKFRLIFYKKFKSVSIKYNPENFPFEKSVGDILHKK